MSIALNRLAETGHWDEDVLRLEFEEMIELGEDVVVSGFEPAEIDASSSTTIPMTNPTTPRSASRALLLSRNRATCGSLGATVSCRAMRVILTATPA